MATRTKGTVFRVTGLRASGPDDEIIEALSTAISEKLKNHGRSNPILTHDAALVPSCYNNEEKAALVEFCGGVPAFLAEIVSNPLGDWQVEMGDTDISFDQHFLGFTQLYTPQPGSPTTAE